MEIPIAEKTVFILRRRPGPDKTRSSMIRYRLHNFSEYGKLMITL